MPLQEQEILKLIANTKTLTQGYEAIVEQYQKPLYWHIRSIVIDHEDANDVLQNTFIKIWRALSKFRGDSKLYTWLYRIATNEALGHLQSEKRRKSLGGDENEEVISTLESDVYFDGDVFQTTLMAAIESLPEKQKLVFKMKYLEELKYEEIADILDTSVGGLKASYHHAVNKIKEFIHED